MGDHKRETRYSNPGPRIRSPFALCPLPTELRGQSGAGPVSSWVVTAR